MLAFTETIFFPIITDTLLVALTLADKQRWLRYATVSVVSSIVGAVVGYFIAYTFFDVLALPLITLYGAQAEFATVQGFFSQSVFLFTLIGAVTPIPYKIFVLTAGFMQVALLPFLLASVIGRGVRFFGVAYLTHRYGEQGVYLVARYSVHLTVVGVALLLVYICSYFFL